MRSGAVCNALLRKFFLYDSVGCRCGWIGRLLEFGRLRGL
jgi:hypothetical protein